MSRLGAMVLCLNMQQSVGAESSPGLLRRAFVNGRTRQKMLVVLNDQVSLVGEQYMGECRVLGAVLFSLQALVPGKLVHYCGEEYI